MSSEIQTNLGDWEFGEERQDEPFIDAVESGPDCRHEESWTVNGTCTRCEHSGPRDAYDGLFEAAGGRSTRNVGGGQ